MARYASGKKSVALCDRCGQQYPYQDLKEQIENRRPNGLRFAHRVWIKTITVTVGQTKNC